MNKKRKLTLKKYNRRLKPGNVSGDVTPFTIPLPADTATRWDEMISHTNYNHPADPIEMYLDNYFRGAKYKKLMASSDTEYMTVNVRTSLVPTLEHVAKSRRQTVEKLILTTMNKLLITHETKYSSYFKTLQEIEDFENNKKK